jgi:hypothetical protein
MKKTLLTTTIIAAIILLPLAWYLLAPLFYDTIVNEEIPTTTNNKNETTTIPVFTTTKEGIFKDADKFHKTTGKAKIIEQENNKILRLENFETTNGPDLYVYLATNEEATDYINLGRLKGNIGNQNYELNNSNTEQYPYVLIWCEQFSTLFGSTKLS